MFERARAEPKLKDVLAAIRREELARAHVQWSELAANRGTTAAGELFGMLDDDDPYWQQRARRAVGCHGLAPTDTAVARAAEAIFEAHLDGADLALEGRSTLTLEIARQAATCDPKAMTSGDRASPALRSAARSGGLNFDEAAERC